MSNDKQWTKIRAERRERGHCLDCGNPRLATTKTGSTSRYCAACLPHRATVKPKPVPVYEVRELKDFRDTKEFCQYRDRIKAWFRRYGVLTIPDINRLLGDLRNDLWTNATLDLLELNEDKVKPVRYSLLEPRAVPRPLFNNSPAVHGPRKGGYINMLKNEREMAARA